MPTQVTIQNSLFHRHDRVDHDTGNAMRRRIRETTPKPRDGNSPFNEAVSLTAEEYDLLRKIRPYLFDDSLDPLTRRKHWTAFLNSSEGAMFRVR